MADHPAPASAQELTASEREKWAKEAYEIESRVKAGLRTGREAMWSTAEALYEFDKCAGWLALGHDKKNEWLADPEVGITERTYRRMVRLWRELAVQRSIPRAVLDGLDPSKLDLVLPAIERGKVLLQQALDDAGSLGWRDLRDEYLSSARADAQDGAGGDGTPEGGESPVGEDEAPRTAEDDSEPVTSTPPKDIDGAEGPEGEDKMVRLSSVLDEAEQALASGVAYPRLARESLALLAGPWLEGEVEHHTQGTESGSLTIVVYSGLAIFAIGEELTTEEARSFTGRLFGQEAANGDRSGIESESAA